MGCDIHLFAETRRDAGAPWDFLPAPSTGWARGDGPRYRYGLPSGNAKLVRPGWIRYEDESDDDAECPIPWFDSRSYELFGILAGVRDETYRPIEEPREWPDDLSDDLHVISERIEHTPHWYLASEIIDAFDRFQECCELPASCKVFAQCLDEMMSAVGVDQPSNVRVLFYFDS